jgi:hypothetical protein
MTPLGFERSNIPFPRRKWILGEFFFLNVFSGAGAGRGAIWRSFKKTGGGVTVGRQIPKTISVMTIAKFSTAFSPPRYLWKRSSLDYFFIIIFGFINFVSHLDSKLPNSTRVNLR